MANQLNSVNKEYEVVVVGGGMAGICTALAAARRGAKTALIHNRPVLGGNASSETRVPWSGASHMGQRKNVREGGIINELTLENRSTNTNDSPVVVDMLLWGKVQFQENLDLFLNTAVCEVYTENEKITAVDAIGLMDETVYHFSSKIFVDCTGDGTMAYLAGADYMTGREGAAEFGETGAISKPDKTTMGNSIIIHWEDTGHPVKFVRPDWAYDFRDKNLGNLTEDDGGFWWVEVGGTKLDIIKDFGEIETELKKIVMGIWDYIKNSGKYDAENYDLRWASTVAGKRESRRFIGDYILNENDLIESHRFPDAVAYGGWHIDSHEPEKFQHKMRELDGLPDTEEKDKSFVLKDIYQIPYRCLYSKNIENLMFAGRNVSVTHRAMASTRVMMTCSMMGQAVGIAAALAVEQGISPREAGQKHIKVIQQQLLKDNCYIPYIQNEDEQDLCRNASVKCSSETAGSEAANVLNGVSREVKENTNRWESEPIKDKEWIGLAFSKGLDLGELRIYFDPDYAHEFYPVQSKWHEKYMIQRNLPKTLVKDFKIILCRGGEEVYSEAISGNEKGLFIKQFADKVECDSVKIEVATTHGCETARIYEIRAYE